MVVFAVPMVSIKYGKRRRCIVQGQSLKSSEAATNLDRYMREARRLTDYRHLINGGE